MSVALSTQPGVSQVPSDDEPVVFDPKSKSVLSLSAELTEAGPAVVSGLIHVLGTNHEYWDHVLLDETSTVEWPESSGITATVGKMRQRCRELAPDGSLRQALNEEQTDVERAARASCSWLQLQLIDQPFY